MGDSNPLGSVSDALGDAWNAASNAAEGVAGAIGSALTTINNFDPLNDIVPGSWGIPGTNIRIDISQLLFGGLIGLPLIGLAQALFYRRPDDNSFITPQNTYFADLKVFINGNYLKSIFVTPAGFASSAEIAKYINQNPQIAFSDICVNAPNSTLTLTFNDNSFDNNDGAINVAICYLGEDADTCGCSTDTVDHFSLAVGFSKNNPNKKYPVECHGMVYVGNNSNGLSTGGRCETSSLDHAETKINEKYTNKYSTLFDDLESKSELEKARVLDLVYKYDGTTWIRQQNLIESVYYHSGVGNDTHAVFFGGIHETISKYTFSYNSDLDNLDLPKFSDFNFDNKFIKDVIEDKLYGTRYPKTLSSSVCWQEPIWTDNSNFNRDHILISNPSYSADTTGNYFNFIKDADFPKFSFLSIPENGSFDFGLSAVSYNNILGSPVCTGTAWKNIPCLINTVNPVTEMSNYQIISGANVIISYPTVDTLTISANFQSITTNHFPVKAATLSISSLPIEFYGQIFIDEIKLQYKNKIKMYPNDVSGAITNEFKGCSLQSIVANESVVNLIGAFQHTFMYTSINGAISGYANRGVFNIMYNKLDDIRDAILTDTYASSVQNLTLIDSLMLPISGTFISGDSQVKFSTISDNGVMVGIQNKNYDWIYTLEDSSFNIAEKFNIIASIGNDTNERWGVPLWSSAFTNDTDYLGNYVFNYRTEFSNGNKFETLYSITNLVFSSNSAMALINNRIYVEGNSKDQVHNVVALNDVEIKAYWNVNTVTYEPNSIGRLYDISDTLGVSGICSYTFTPSSTLVNITGGIQTYSLICNSGDNSFPDLNCCSGGGHLFPSHFFLKSISDSISSTDGTRHINVEYNYIDECIWNISSVNFVPSGSLTYQFDSSTNCLYSCPNTTVESLVTGTITSSNEIFEFPTDSDNFILNSVSPSILSSGTYLKTVTYNFVNNTKWKFDSYNTTAYLPINCTLTSISAMHCISGNNYITGSAESVVSSAISGSFSSIGSACCSGIKMFPNDFTFISSTEFTSSGKLYSNVRYDLFNTCANTLQTSINLILLAKNEGTLISTLEACPAGIVQVQLKTCVIESCESLITHENPNHDINVGDSGNVYSEYSTNFIQEFRDDGRYKVPEYVVTSNANNVLTPNKGIMLQSKWKRYMDGVGLGGDSPNYDTISILGSGFKTVKIHPVTQWREIGFWNIGQMIFGTVDKSVIVGGHKISRSVGQTLLGSGMHSSPTSKRIYIWNTEDIPEEDSYLKNYYGRRFNTYYTTNTSAISANGNRSDLNCIIFEAESNIDVERFGTVFFESNTNSVNVTFATPMSDDVGANYYVALTCSENIKVWWENKTTSGFTIKSEMSNWTGTVDYMATVTMKTTEQDIIQNPPENGYIFNK